MDDALTNFKDKDGSGGLFLRFEPDKPVKLRVLTNDPLVNTDKFGNTRFSFVVWNWDESKAQVLSKGASILKQLKAIHTDADYGDIRKLDIKITATGEGMETRYAVMPLPKSGTLTKEQADEAAKIELEHVIKGGIRLSEFNEGKSVPEPDSSSDEYPVADEDINNIPNFDEDSK